MSYESRKVIRESAQGLSIINIQDQLLDQRNVYLNSPLTEETALELIHQFMYLESRTTEEPINFFINSPGGSVSDGMLVYDYLRMMKSRIRTICTGRACSMAALLLLAGEERWMFKHAECMIHDASFAKADFSGLKPDEIEERTKELVETCRMLRDIISDRTGKSLEEVTKKMKKDSFFKADEAVEFGLATGIVESAGEMIIDTNELL